MFKNDFSYHTRLKNRLLWTHDKRFMEPLFGVIASGTAGSLQTKMELYLANLTRTRMHQDGRNIHF